jgi:hypothetical protein
MRPSLFWVVTQLRMVVTDVSEHTIDPISKDGLILEDETDRSSRNIGNY